ncbi:phage tail protein [Lacticaseibacillus rhamnosus]|uniref:distal tail protein Dit n=1 Tax=Lacticaseibacillus rhamnosus TaxID=47715 RepID=UPI0007E0B9A9|nr:distal tail protein Dit [Lacticaseibacillus rhamnosus]MCT3191314.1 phage tail protein [Lacticaseibacillus rhamnosus]MCT3372531.1 phage tail protein [Lacticaseibacillus rhamnosus]OAU13442.1 tail protein [Lacticaseibacillus rhamnosus]OAU21866.1 tail protein [Lacticaseibacillus rhamnosus]
MKQAGVTITYAGVDITKWMYVQMVKRDVGTNHVNTMQKVGISDGQMLQYMSRDVKTIVVTGIVMNDDLVPLRRSLAAAIDADEPQQLIFGDEPDKYYLAIVDSQPTFTEGFRSGTISISFVCPDGGIAHSVATQTFDNMPYKDIPLNLMAGTSADPVSVTGSGWNAQKLGSFNNPTVGKKYAATVLLGRADFAVSFQLWANDINGNRISLAGFPVTTQMGANQRSTIVCTWPDPGTTGAAQIEVTLAWAFQKTDVGTYQYIKAKLEEGTTYSTWSPNPADPEYYADTITVTNSGTVPVPVKVTSKFSSDDGFLGLTLNGRYYQVGNTKEVNGITYDDSQMLVKTRPTIDKYILNDPSFAVIPADQGVMTQTGTVTIKPDPTNQLGITTPSDFGPNNHGPHGPSLIYKLPADSNGEVGAVNCILRMHAGLGALSLDSPSDTRQVGQICMTIYDASKNAMARILYSDMSQTTSDFTVRYDLNGTKVHEEDFSNTPGFTGHCYIRKSGSQFIFAWGGEAGGTAQTYTCEELADTKVMYVSFNFLQWADLPLPHYFGLIEWNFEKDYVDLYKDLPNYFKAGDIVTLDSSTNLLTINQYTDWDRVDIGSQPLLAPPGQSTLGIVVSPWANLPAVSTELREGWL